MTQNGPEQVEALFSCLKALRFARFQSFFAYEYSRHFFFTTRIYRHGHSKKVAYLRCVPLAVFFGTKFLRLPRLAAQICVMSSCMEVVSSCMNAFNTHYLSC